MSYGRFVGELNKGIEGCIVAYDNKKERGGCILYLKQRPCTIFVPATLIEQQRQEAICAIREKIRAFDWGMHHWTLVNDCGVLVFEPEPEPESRPIHALA